MLSELHQQGFEPLRAPAYLVLMAWRCPIVPASWTLTQHGGKFEYPSSNLGELLAVGHGKTSYTSASGQAPFGWPDVAFASPRELALRFIRENSASVVAGWGPDPEYIAWFQEALYATAPNGIYISFSEDWTGVDHLRTFATTTEKLRLPPGGGLDKNEFESYAAKLNYSV